MNLRANFSSICLIVFLLVLGACNPAPKYAKPPAQTPVAFKEAIPDAYKEGQGWKLAQPGEDKLGGKWWTIYNDAQLGALLEQVAISNQTIIQAEANFRSARAIVLQSRSSLFPVVTTSPAYTNSRISSTARGGFVVGAGGTTTTTTGGTTTSGTTTGTSTGTTTSVGSTSSNIINNFTLPVDVTYTVDLWHRVRNTIAANEFSAQASAADVASAILSTQAELATDYFQVRALDEQRRILEDTLANYRASLQLTQTLFNAGIDSDEEVSQAQTQVDTATAQLTDLGVARATYEHAMAVLIGKPPSIFALPVAPFVPHPPAIPVALPSELLERRPDIAAAERRVASANAEIGVARSAYFPNLTLSASGGFQTSSLAQWFTWPSRFWSLGPTFAQTLFQAGSLQAVTAQAEANYDVTVATYRESVLTAFQAVEDNLSTLRILSDEVVQQQTAVRSATHYLDLSTTRFKSGVDSYLNVITAQNIVLTNRETEVQIQLRQMTSSVALVMALGGGWDQKLPSGRDLRAKSAKWEGAGKVPNPGQTATPNPPPVKANPND